jgi:hypothetical protein
VTIQDDIQSLVSAALADHEKRVEAMLAAAKADFQQAIIDTLMATS